MIVKDTSTNYGLVSRALHWVMAIGIFAMFGLGWWMVDLDYYSPYYKSAPDLHRSVGIVLLTLLALRIVWRTLNAKPNAIAMSPVEGALSRIVHAAFYPLLLALMVAGYFISTLDGRVIDVFGLFEIPSIYESKGLEETAGLIHRVLAYATIALALLHAAGALKHHFIDRSNILRRMLTGSIVGPNNGH